MTRLRKLLRSSPLMWYVRRLVGASIPALLLVVVTTAEYKLGDQQWRVDALAIPLLWLGVLAALMHLGRHSRW